MKVTIMKSAVVCLFALTLCWAQNPGEQARSKIRIGILALDVSGLDAAATAAINEDLVRIIDDMGFYALYPQADLEKAFATIKQPFPKRCREPRCVTEIGSALQLDRMIFGSFDKDGAAFGVRLTLVDVQQRRVVENVSIQGAPGVAAGELLKEAVLKVHGLESQAGVTTQQYFGPQFDNMKQMLVASGVVVGAGLLWAAINGGLSDFDFNKKYDAQQLSGRVSSSINIPLFGRPAALANQYVAASDDAYGVLYNPAGMAWLPHGDMALGYQYRFGLINNFAASFANKATREIGFGACVLYTGDYDHLQDELFFVSSYAYKFNQRIGFLRPFSVGASVKIINKTAPESDNATASQKTLGGGVDIGFLTELSDNIRFGCVLKDALTVEKINNTMSGQIYTEYYPQVLLLGGTYRLGYSTFLICEGQVPLFEDQAWKFSGGMEQEMFRFFKVRWGIKKEAYFDTPWLFTGGFGIDVNTEALAGKYVMVDGAYEYSTLGVLPVANLSFRIGF